MHYAFNSKQSTIYLTSGTAIVCPFAAIAAVDLDKIEPLHPDSAIRESVKLAFFPDMHDKHINVERDDDMLIVYTTGSNLINNKFRGCILRWKAN